MTKTYTFDTLGGRGICTSEGYDLCEKELRVIFGTMPDKVILSVSNEKLPGYTRFHVTIGNYVSTIVKNIERSFHIDASLIFDMVRSGILKNDGGYDMVSGKAYYRVEAYKCQLL